MKLIDLQRWRENSRVFRFYFKKYRRYYLIGILALVVVDGLEILPPLLLLAAVDAVSNKDPNLSTLLLKIAAAYMLVAFLQGAMRYLWRKYIIRTSMFSSNDMRDELFVHLSTLAPGFYKKKRVGDLVSLSTNDIEAVRFALGPGALTFFDATFYFIAIPPIMFWISPQLTLISFLPLLVVPIFVRKMEGLIQKHFREVQDQFSVLASNCQEALGGIRIIKGSALEQFKEREFNEYGREYRNANLRSVRTQATLTAGLEAILSASTTILFLVGGSFVISDKITIGMFVAFQRYIQKMSWPMEAFGLAANIFQRSIASQKRIDEVMLVQAGIIDPPKASKLSSTIPSIEVRNLSFSHPGSAHASLKNISFQIPAGVRLGITGGVGSGKSTLLACLARMEPVPPGTIFFDGIDVCDLPLAEIRSRISFVPQESFLFSRTVEENILYGNSALESPDPTKKLSLAREAALLASIDKEVHRFPAGYQTILGERGLNISGGQRQRLTIARAIARKPQMLLLDDCMSAIDAETEKSLLQGILKASEGISLIVASHRISTFDQLDWLIHLEAGEIKGSGKPRELVNENESLRELSRLQSKEGVDLLK